MGQLVCTGAMIRCSFGAAPATLTALPLSRVQGGGAPPATVADARPLVNIPTFGTCTSLANPIVAAATAAALGALTPMPCIPATGTPWVPGSPTVILGGQAALSNTSTCRCAYGGVVAVVLPGPARIEVP